MEQNKCLFEKLLGHMQREIHRLDFVGRDSRNSRSKGGSLAPLLSHQSLSVEGRGEKFNIMGNGASMPTLSAVINEQLNSNKSAKLSIAQLSKEKLPSLRGESLRTVNEETWTKTQKSEHSKHMATKDRFTTKRMQICQSILKEAAEQYINSSDMPSSTNITTGRPQAFLTPISLPRDTVPAALQDPSFHSPIFQMLQKKLKFRKVGTKSSNKHQQLSKEGLFSHSLQISRAALSNTLELPNQHLLNSINTNALNDKTPSPKVDKENTKLDTSTNSIEDKPIIVEKVSNNHLKFKFDLAQSEDIPALKRKSLRRLNPDYSTINSSFPLAIDKKNSHNVSLPEISQQENLRDRSSLNRSSANLNDSVQLNRLKALILLKNNNEMILKSLEPKKGKPKGAEKKQLQPAQIEFQLIPGKKEEKATFALQKSLDTKILTKNFLEVYDPQRLIEHGERKIKEQIRMKLRALQLRQSNAQNNGDSLKTIDLHCRNLLIPVKKSVETQITERGFNGGKSYTFDGEDYGSIIHTTFDSSGERHKTIERDASKLNRTNLIQQ